MIIDFRLKVFLTVARTLSFTKAAATLCISQPAISKHIKELEICFGEPLFNRKGNTITLTQKGVDIIPYVESIIDGYNTLNDTILKEDSLYEGSLRIGASTTIAQYVLPTILARFNDRYPLIRLSMISANSDEVVNMLQCKEVDIALIEGDNTNTSVHYSPFASDKIVLVSTNKRAHPLTIDELSKIPLLIREEGSGTLSVILSALRAKGIVRKALNIKMQLGSSEAILRYIRSSKAYAFISILVAQDDINSGKLIINEVEDLKIERVLRYVSLHGQSGRLIEMFKEFCSSHYNI